MGVGHCLAALLVEGCIKEKPGGVVDNDGVLFVGNSTSISAPLYGNMNNCSEILPIVLRQLGNDLLKHTGLAKQKE